MSAYSFQKISVGQFNVYKSMQTQNDSHQKKFALGVTPLNQQTLNVYVSGDFEFKCGEFTQVLHAGDTSMDLTIATFPSSLVCTEKVLSPTGLRFCISPVVLSAWNRSKLSLSGQTSFAEESVLLILDGEIAGKSIGEVILAQPNQLIEGTGSVIRCWI